MSRVDDPPARGTRPRNRREITLTMATDLFYRRGYPAVSMSDIAQEMNVGASAIYRHFSSKSDLLVAAIRAGIAPYREILDSATDLAVTLRALAECALDNRELGVLWQREARNLAEDDIRSLREHLAAATRGLGRLLVDTRPGLSPADADLLVWCILSALVSVGFHTLTLPREAYVELLVELATSIAHTELPTGDASTSTDPDAASGETRRDVVVEHATELFAERGYGAVGIDDIGDSVGIAGPSIYSHFPSKQKILAEAITRGNSTLRRDAAVALASGDSPHGILARLIRSYVHLAVGNRFVIRIVLSELGQLDPEDREFARRQQREYIETWTGLVQRNGRLDPVPARILVQAVLLVVNDVVQTPHLRSQPGFESRLRRVADHMLGLV